MAIMVARTTAAPARTTAATIPPTATIRSTMVGKQSRNLGPPASTDLTDTAGGPGAIGERAPAPAERAALTCCRASGSRLHDRVHRRIGHEYPGDVSGVSPRVAIQAARAG
jgi:hypothetical protein